MAGTAYVCQFFFILSLLWSSCRAAQHAYHQPSSAPQQETADDERVGDAATLLNDEFYFPSYRPEIFYDTRVLPDDKEVAVFVFSDEPKRYFYIVDREHGPFSLTVTPCAEEIEWRLSLVLTGGPTVKGHHQEKSDYIGSPPRLALVTSYEGQERYTYTSLTAPAGTYVLDITSRGHDTNVRIYATVDPEGRFPYPHIPRNSKVEVLKVRENRVLISWPTSPVELRQGEPIEFCVVANPRENYHTHCGLLTEMHGDIPQPPPTTVGFGFWSEKQHRKKILQKIHEIRSNLKKRHDIVYECVGRRTWHIFKGLERGKTYYFDVFAINMQTNFSSNYPGTQATIPLTDPGINLKENVLTPLVLDESNGYTVKTNYDLHMPAQALWFFLQSCTGPGPLRVTIADDMHDLITAQVMDLKTLRLQQPSNGSYTVTVSSDVESTRSAAILVSRKHHKYPYPVLPEDKRIKVFVTLTTCDSVTLAWFTTEEEKVRYCIFQRAEQEGAGKTFDKPRNICKEPFEHNAGRREKVLCRRYHRFSKRRFNNVIMQKIRGLQPATTYVFDIHVTKFRGKTLPYEEVWVTTSNKCTTDNRTTST